MALSVPATGGGPTGSFRVVGKVQRRERRKAPRNRTARKHGGRVPQSSAARPLFNHHPCENFGTQDAHGAARPGVRPQGRGTAKVPSKGRGPSS